MDGKLRAVLGWSMTLLLASLGALAGTLHGVRWLPDWVGIGLLLSALVWAGAGYQALRGLRPEDWMPPGIEPDLLWRPEVLAPGSTAEGVLRLASALQSNIEVNNRQNAALTRRLQRAMALLLLGILPGGVVGVLFVLDTLIRQH